MTVVSIVFWGLLVISVVIFLHEAGHYLAARLGGVRATELFLGLPCPVRLAFRSKRTGTLVGITPLLFGGYTRICGMAASDDPRMEEVFACVCRHGRVEVSTIARELAFEDEDDVFGVLAVLVDWAAVEPYYNPDLGERPSQSAWPAAFQTVARDASGLTIYDTGNHVGEPGTHEAGEVQEVVNPQQALARERSRTYLGSGFFTRVAILIAGPLMNFITALFAIVIVLSVLGVEQIVDLPIISAVSEGSFAEAAGLQAGDALISIGGISFDTWTGMSEAIDAAFETGESFEVVWEHEGQTMSASVVPREGDTMLGVVATTELYKVSPLVALRIGFDFAREVVNYAIQLITPNTALEILNQSTSVVGIAVMSQQAARAGISAMLELIASISMSLSIMNLLPIPPLDGGKIALELLEVLRRRPLSTKTIAALNVCGMILLLLVFMWVLHTDIIRYFLS